MTSYGMIMHSLPAFKEDFLPSAMPRRTWLVRAWSQPMVLMPRWEMGNFPDKLMVAVVDLYPRILPTYCWNIPSQTFVTNSLAKSWILWKLFLFFGSWSCDYCLKSYTGWLLLWLEISRFISASLIQLADSHWQVSPSKLHFQADVKRPRVEKHVVFFCFRLVGLSQFSCGKACHFFLGESNLPNLW